MVHKEKNRDNFFYKYPGVWISLLLIITTLVVFLRVRNYEFINYDDDDFITENSLIQSGLTLESIKSATIDELAAIKGISRSLAERIHLFFVTSDKKKN